MANYLNAAAQELTGHGHKTAPAAHHLGPLHALFASFGIPPGATTALAWGVLVLLVLAVVGASFKAAFG
jgi:hypothetical protein